MKKAILSVLKKLGIGALKVSEVAAETAIEAKTGVRVDLPDLTAGRPQVKIRAKRRGVEQLLADAERRLDNLLARNTATMTQGQLAVHQRSVSTAQNDVAYYRRRLETEQQNAVK